MTDEGARPIRHGRRWLLFVLPVLLVVVIGGWLGYGWLNPLPPPIEGVELSDPALEPLLRTALRRTGPWTEEDLATVRAVGESINHAFQWPFPRSGRRIDITSVAQCANLQSLCLSEYQAEDLTPLSRLTELQTLEIACPGADSGDDCDLVPLQALTKLRTLSLNLGNTGDLGALSRLTELRELVLFSSYPGNRFDLTPLADLVKLQKLHLYLPNLGDVSSLMSMTDLRELAIGYGAQPLPLRNVSALAGLTRLEELLLSGNRIEDVGPLSGLVNLRVLFLGSNRISDITPLAELTSLQWLSLGKNRISDISVVAGLSDLRRLYLDGNQITDISPLAGLTRLGETAPLELRARHFRRSVKLTGVVGPEGGPGTLRLAGNQISDISLLSQLTELKKVLLMHNPLDDEAYAVHIPALQERGVDVRFDPRP